MDSETGGYFGAVAQPDGSARAHALGLHDALTKPPGSLGRLDELGAWLAACQGSSPPRPLARPRIVLFAGDHGVAARGVSVYPAGATARLVDAIRDGRAPVAVMAEVAGAGLLLVDVAVDSDATGEHKIRRGSGAIDVEDALTHEETVAALRAGAAIADAEVDSGADLLAASGIGTANSTVASVLVAALTGTEPVAVIGRGSGIDDQAWMRKTVAVRDALRRAKPVLADPVALLRTVGGADFAAMTGFVAQAAIRRTPVLLDGLASVAAALVAEELAAGARAWWAAADLSAEPAHALAIEHLGLAPVLDLGSSQGQGTTAAAALPLLTMSARVLAAVPTP